jgi:tol-pal system protein YbgF
MVRQLLLPSVVFMFVLGFGATSMPLVAWSQDRSTDERLDRVERDLNMLQRQVYRGGPPPPMGADGGPGAANVEVRMNRIESQMRDLTGRIEEFTNQLEQVRRRVEQINGDVDMRFSQGANTAPGQVAAAGPAAARSAPPPPARDRAERRPQFPPPPQPTDDDDDQAAPAYHAAGPTSLTPGGGYPPGGPSAVFGTLTPPGAPPYRAPEMAGGGAAPPQGEAQGGALPNGSAAEQYNYAFGLLKQAKYPAAEAALRAFVQQHPRDAMAGNAQYWLGETFYTRGKYMEAASTFAEGYKRYPKGSKAADGLLKLGMALGRADQKQNACVALAQLDRDFANPAASIKERAAAEKKKLGC